MTKKISVINVKQKLSLFSEQWSPKIAGEVNDCYVKMVKFKGEFDWHKHDEEDELFWVIKGSFVLLTREESLEVNEGEFVIVPRGLEHKPVAEQEAEVVLIEPKSTLNTGDVTTDKTLKKLDWI